MKRGRPTILGLSLALVAGAGFWQYTATGQTETALGSEPRVASVAETGSRGAVWFCPLVASTAENAQASLRITRFLEGDEPVTVQTTLYGPAGEIARSTDTIDVGAVQVGVASLLRTSDTGTLPSIAATVESDDVGIIVEASLGANSSGFVPCATAVAPRWYLPVGSTRLQHNTELALFNPFPGTAIVDLQFWSERGAARPTALQGVAVPGHGLRIVELGDFVRRRERLATEVTVRSGRVLAATNHRFEGTSELVLGMPGGSSTWFNAISRWEDKRAERYTVLNPGETDAVLELSATLSANDVEPFEITVPAGSTVVFEPDAEGRIPADTDYSIAAQVSEGPNLIIARSVDPLARSGPHFSQTATAVTAEAWVVPTSDAGQITVFNPYDVPTSVTITSGTSGTSGADNPASKPFTLTAGAFRTLTVNEDQQGAGSVTVRADGPPVVVAFRSGDGVAVGAVPIVPR
jgi:hypothetical protein